MTTHSANAMAASLAAALCLCEASARAQGSQEEDRPRIVVDAEAYSAEATGLPAISADGSTIAAVEYFETLSDASQLVILLLRTDAGGTTERVVVYEVDDGGTRRPFPEDGRGTTLWRRAQTLNALFASDNYVSMYGIEVVDPRSGEGPASGLSTEAPRAQARLRVEQVSGLPRLVVRRAATGRRVHAGRLERMTYFCGMEGDEPPRQVWPNVVAAWEDDAGSSVLIQYGIVYASCMCFNELDYRAIHVERQ